MKFSDFLASWRAFVVCERFPTRGRKSELRKQRNLPLRRQIPDLCHSDVINTHPDTQIPGSSYINANFVMLSHLTRFGWIFLSSFQSAKGKRTAVVFQQRDGPSLLERQAFCSGFLQSLACKKPYRTKSKVHAPSDTSQPKFIR